MTRRDRLSAYLLIPTASLITGMAIGSIITLRPSAPPAKPWPTSTQDQVLICFDRAGHPTTGPNWTECRSIKL